MPNYLTQIMPPRQSIVDEHLGVELLPLPAPARQSFMDWLLGRSESERAVTEFRELTVQMDAARAYFDARRQAVESCINAGAAEYRLRELPHVTSDGERYRQEERGAQHRALQDRRYLTELQQELAHIDAQIRTLAAHQRLGARYGLGRATEWNTQGIELLDAEMGIAERRAVLREQAGHTSSAESVRQDDLSGIEELLHEARAQLRASGLDTTRLDEEITRLARRRIPR